MHKNVYMVSIEERKCSPVHQLSVTSETDVNMPQDANNMISATYKKVDLRLLNVTIIYSLHRSQTYVCLTRIIEYNKISSGIQIK